MFLEDEVRAEIAKLRASTNQPLGVRQNDAAKLKRLKHLVEALQQQRSLRQQLNALKRQLPPIQRQFQSQSSDMSQISQLEKAIAAYDEPARYVAVDDGSNDEVVDPQQLISAYYGMNKPPTPTQVISSASVLPLSIDSTDLMRVPADNASPSQPQYVPQPFAKPPTVVSVQPAVFSGLDTGVTERRIHFIEEPATGQFVRVRGDVLNIGGAFGDGTTTHTLDSGQALAESLKELHRTGLTWQHGLNWASTILAGIAAGVALMQLFIGLELLLAILSYHLYRSLFPWHTHVRLCHVACFDRTSSCHVCHGQLALCSVDMESAFGLCSVV